MVEHTPYGIKTKVSLDYEGAILKVTDELKKEGFGILTEINVKETLKQKIDVEFRNYIILGACNPKLAHQVLQAETDIGILMPCNVIVYEDDGGDVVVAAMNPSAAMGVVGNPEVVPTAAEVTSKLERVIGAMAG
jgi:uncharacterized protein (DUF302 family)